MGKGNFKKKVGMCLSTMAVLAVICATQVQAFSISGQFYLKKATVHANWATKTTSTDAVQYRLLSVYPTYTRPGASDDTYKRIKIGAVDVNKNTLMPIRVIYEGSSMSSYYYSRNLSAGDRVAFLLMGNDPTLAAYAQVYLNWY